MTDMPISEVVNRLIAEPEQIVKNGQSFKRVNSSDLSSILVEYERLTEEVKTVRRQRDDWCEIATERLARMKAAGVFQ